MNAETYYYRIICNACIHPDEKVRSLGKKRTYKYTHEQPSIVPTQRCKGSDEP